MFRRVVTAVLAIGPLFLATLTFANSATDWSLVAGGTYSWNGSSSGGLVGANIPSSVVLGNGTPLHNGVFLPILNGLLNFASGAYNGTGSNWSWGAGSPGTLNLTGCIAGVTDGGLGCTGSNNVALLSDDFQSVQIVPLSGSLDVVFGNITGSINPLVASYFGVSKTFATASFTTSISTNGLPGKAFTGTNILGLISAAPPVSAAEFWGIGESLAFFALVLVAFGVMIRSRVIQPVRSKAL